MLAYGFLILYIKVASFISPLLEFHGVQSTYMTLICTQTLTYLLRCSVYAK